MQLFKHIPSTNVL